MLLGLTGRARAGKDTVYGFVAEWARAQALPIRREAFADRMKLSLARLFDPDIDLPGALAWADAVKETGTLSLRVHGSSPVTIPCRTALERFGDESHRKVLGEDIWFGPVFDGYHFHNHELLVVTDVRYEDEAREIILRGGRNWQLIRPSVPQRRHRSEAGLPDSLVHHTILNDGNLHQLRRRIHSTLDQHLILDAH